MSKLTDNLRKAGVLHTSKGDYQTGEFDDRKDMKDKEVSAQSAASSAPQTGEGSEGPMKNMDDQKNDLPEENPSEKKSSTGRKVTFWFAIICAAFFLLMSLGSWGVFTLTIVIWSGLLYLLKLWAFSAKFSTVLITFAFLGVFILSFMIVPTDTDTDISGETAKNGAGSTSLAPTTKCEANDLDVKENEYIELKIVSVDNMQEDHTKALYSIDELDALQFGHQSQLTQDGYYSIDELCQGEKTLSFDDLEAWNYNKSVKGSVGGFGGNYTNFTSEQDDGSVSRTIEEPGTFTQYAYISHDGKKWFIAQEREFEVQ